MRCLQRFFVVLVVALGIAVLGSGNAFAAGNGETQGHSMSNPDGGGVDKPYAADAQPAMSQGTSDFDGNNGCGNDDDRADDNNGWCGRHHSPSLATDAAESLGTGPAAPGPTTLDVGSVWDASVVAPSVPPEAFAVSAQGN